MKREQIEMTAGQTNRMNRLIRAECCNCVDDICIVLDHGYGFYCPQMGMRILFCPWLREAVLPLDERLRRDLIGDIRMKPCEMCRREFSPKSNRARFCNLCAQKRRKSKEAERQRERYRRSTHLDHPEAACGADSRAPNSDSG